MTNNNVTILGIESGLAYILIGEDGEASGPVAKNLSDAERNGIAAHVGAQPGDCIFFAAGEIKVSRALLGAARGEIARKLGDNHILN